jgi:putative ABC transport system permease protein
MTLASILPVGLLAGLIGMPVGIVAQHAVLTHMGQIAAKANIPASVFDVFPMVMFVALALSGVAIGIAGAMAPARRASVPRIAPVLQAE